MSQDNEDKTKQHSTRKPSDSSKQQKDKKKKDKLTMKERVGEQREQLDKKRADKKARKIEKNKGNEEREYVIVPFIKRYGFLIGVIVIILGISHYNNIQSEKNVEIADDIETIKENIYAKESDLDSLKESYDEDAFVQEVKDSTVSAEEFGKDIIEVDNVLTSHYKKPNLYPDLDDKKAMAKIDKELAKYTKLDTKLRGTKKGAHVGTWQLNPDWDLELETLMTYKNTIRFPIIFRMTTADDENAGIVYGQYNVEDNLIEDVNIHYTDIGMDDEASIGGD